MSSELSPKETEGTSYYGDVTLENISITNMDIIGFNFYDMAATLTLRIKDVTVGNVTEGIKIFNSNTNIDNLYINDNLYRYQCLNARIALRMKPALEVLGLQEQ